MKHLFATLAVVGVLTTPALADDIGTIASAGGDVSEILFELGVGDKVVAVDTTTVFPAATDDLPRIGYVRELSAEGVLSTGADLLIGSYDMGPPEVMENLEAAGMQVAYVPDGVGPSRYSDKVAFIADAVGAEARGAEMIAAYEAELAALATRVDGMERSPRALMILAVRDGSPIAAGTGTTGNDMIVVTGGENMATYEGWGPMTGEAVIAAAPEIIFLSSIHVDRMGGIEAVMELPSIQATPAGENMSYVVLNSQMMLQFGPRATQAMDEMVTALEAVKAE